MAQYITEVVLRLCYTNKPFPNISSLLK